MWYTIVTTTVMSVARYLKDSASWAGPAEQMAWREPSSLVEPSKAEDQQLLWQMTAFVVNCLLGESRWFLRRRSEVSPQAKARLKRQAKGVRRCSFLQLSRIVGISTSCMEMWVLLGILQRVIQQRWSKLIIQIQRGKSSPLDFQLSTVVRGFSKYQIIFTCCVQFTFIYCFRLSLL